LLYRLVISSQQQEADRILLDSQQQHYLRRVLRLTDGDRFLAMDGIGKTWIAEIVGETARCLELLEVATELPFDVSLITALPKGNGYEQILRCCTELGVTRFLPTISSRTMIKPSNNKVERWRKIVIESAEQAERQIVPQVIAPVSFTETIQNLTPVASSRYICVARGDFPSLWSCLQNSSLQHLIIATGTEGGWTAPEVEQAIAAKFQPVSLGKRILRAVTAPITALSLVTAIHQ
jgi:16S rRNA (uracil1498-N3)-methyltransferase